MYTDIHTQELCNKISHQTYFLRFRIHFVQNNTQNVHNGEFLFFYCCNILNFHVCIISFFSYFLIIYMTTMNKWATTLHLYGLLTKWRVWDKHFLVVERRRHSPQSSRHTALPPNDLYCKLALYMTLSMARSKVLKIHLNWIQTK